MISLRCFFSRRVEEVIFERKSPVVILTMSSSAVPRPGGDTTCIRPRHAGVCYPVGRRLNSTPAREPAYSSFDVADTAMMRIQAAETLLRAGVIVDDPPAFGELAKDQREHTMRLLAIRHDELKLPSHERGIRAQRLHLQIAERQRSHGMTFRLVAATVALQGRFPPLRLGGSGEKCQIGRVPVAVH